MERSPLYALNLSGLEYVPAGDLTTGDLFWLTKATEVLYTGVHMPAMAKTLHEGELTVWRMLKPMEGVILLELVEHPKGKELVIWGLAGKRLFPKNHYRIYKDLREIAKFFDCKWLGTCNPHPALDRFYEELPWNRISVVYREELK